jgi:hypothetical protein
MSEADQGLLVLAVASVGSAILFHSFVRSYAKASGLAAVVAAIVFQVAASIHLGHIDPFALIGLVTGGLFALVVALVVGIPFQVVRARAGASDKV